MNYFNILQLPLQFHISTEQLDIQLFKISTTSQNTQLLNDAYNILQDDFLRGEHIIHLRSPNINLKELSPDNIFLNKIFNYHSIFEKTNTQIIKIKQATLEKIQIDYKNTYNLANKAFQSNNMQLFAIYIIQIKFLYNLLKQYD